MPACLCFFFFFSSRRRHTRCGRDWSSDVCSSDLSRSDASATSPYSSKTFSKISLLPSFLHLLGGAVKIGFLQQFLVRSHIGQATVFQYEVKVAALEHAHAVGDQHQHGGDFVVEELLNQETFGVGIHGRKHIVEHQQLTRCVKGAGETDSLFLSPRQHDAFFAHHGLLLLGKAGQLIGQGTAKYRLFYFRRVHLQFLAKSDVVLHRIRKQKHILTHRPYPGAHILATQTGSVRGPVKELSRLRLQITVEQIHQGRFSGPQKTGNANDLSGFNPEVQIFQDRCFPIVVLKSQIRGVHALIQQMRLLLSRQRRFVVVLPLAVHNGLETGNSDKALLKHGQHPTQSHNRMSQQRRISNVLSQLSNGKLTTDHQQSTGKQHHNFEHLLHAAQQRHNKGPYPGNLQGKTQQRNIFLFHLILGPMVNVVTFDDGIAREERYGATGKPLKGFHTQMGILHHDDHTKAYDDENNHQRHHTVQG